MIDKVTDAIEKYGMPIARRRVVVALSGGSDSMCLLHILYKLRDEYDLTLEAAHVNHGIRGESAERDMNFAVNECKKLGIKCHVLRADVPAYAKETGMSLEEAGRKVRYDFFASFGESTFIATAHNLSDRIETLLFNFARGSSLRGLCSIPPVRGNIIRPLIDCTKDEIVDYCKVNGIDYITDETNDDIKYSRNRIRHRVITELKEINPAFEECAFRCLDAINDDEEYLSYLAKDAVKAANTENGYRISPLLTLAFPVLRRAVYMIIIAETGESPDTPVLEDAIKALYEYECHGKGRLIQLGKGLFLRTRAGIIEKPENVDCAPAEAVLDSPEMIFGVFTVKTAVISPEEYKLKKDSGSLFMDRDKINGSIRLRTRLEGDRISPAGRGVSKSLRKLQNEKGIPPEYRETAPVFCDDSGIIAACFCCVDESVKIDVGTRNIFEISIEKGDGSFV
ncbi:MAG: tRNA lysidine(34) synthetase TilS [Clostridia bacterium]|nr:tRNA lysidine(34) synthetase TilS [Clostridia bacterium]